MNITRPIEKEPEHDAQPAMKKRKIENPPNIIMQAATFDGLKDLRECINICIKHLEKTVAFVNRTRDSIMEFLKGNLAKEETERRKQILKDCTSFKHYYTLLLDDIINDVKSKMGFSNVSDFFANFILAEIYAFGLLTLAKDIYEFVFEQ